MLNVASSAAAAPRWRQQEPALRRFLKIPDEPGRKESDAMIINEVEQHYLRNPQYAKQGLPRPQPHRVLTHTRQQRPVSGPRTLAAQLPG
jgi:hypothetical protein